MSTETVDVVSGLLTQKPGREPEIGQTKCFTVEKKVSERTGKPWIKVKNATPDKGGSNYRILNVQSTGHEDAHGNISFNVELEPVPNGGAPAASSPHPATSTHQPHQNASIDPVGACKGHLEKCSQAMLMVMKEAIGIATEWEAITKAAMPPEHLQALCSTLFIQLSPTRRDHDYISALPVNELEKPF